MYRILFQYVLRHLDSEVTHNLAHAGLGVLGSRSLGRALLSRAAGPSDPVLEVRALGRTFSSPLGLAAGMDKEAKGFASLLALGFGFAEIGTVTAHPQPGNPRPRITRAVADRALVNWMGFPNPGAAAVASRLAVARSSKRLVPAPIGINIGKSRIAELADAGADYRSSVRALAPLADYLAVNVSSPNTPGVRDLQSPDRLHELLHAIREELESIGSTPPLLVKISPDLSDREIDAIAQLAVELGLDGIIAVNTTTDHSALTDPGAVVAAGRGGVSGAPLARRADAVLRRLAAVTTGRLVLISVGGVQSARDVWDRLRAGATLVQAYTGFIYGGPRWPARTNRELARLVRAAGYSSVQEAIGADAKVTV